MWSNRLFKTNAKAVLHARLLPILGVNLLALLVTAMGGAVVFRSHMLNELVGIAFTVFVGSVIPVGLCRYMMESRIGAPPVQTLFSVFKCGYTNVVLVQLLVALKITLGYLLIVPGIYWQLSYVPVPYLLAENPQMQVGRAMELSSALMKGEKLRLFGLYVSFLGWSLLVLLTCGVAALYATPYINAVKAEFYAAMRAKAFACGLSDETELGGFYSY